MRLYVTIRSKCTKIEFSIRFVGKAKKKSSHSLPLFSSAGNPQIVVNFHFASRTCAKISTNTKKILFVLLSKVARSYRIQLITLNKRVIVHDEQELSFEFLSSRDVLKIQLSVAE